MKLTNSTKLLVTAAVLFALFAGRVEAGPVIIATLFASAPPSTSSPDSVVFGNGSLYIAYQNGAPSTGGSGASSVVQYSLTGAILNTFSVAGNVDGLRIDPSGQIWALQNNDGNSTLTLINPVAGTPTLLTYGNTYTNVANRGFDDAEFLNGQVFLSETNPATSTDPVILKLTSPVASPLQVSGILNSTFTGTNLATGAQASTTITDPDSLILSPLGDLVLTGEGDQEIVFVHNPGALNQTASFVALLSANGMPITGTPDDTVYATAPSGTFYIADTGANKVYALSASGLTPGSIFVDVGGVFGSLDTTTGRVTPLFTGVSLHGALFVPAPEPASFFLAGTVLLIGAVLMRRRRMQ